MAAPDDRSLILLVPTRVLLPIAAAIWFVAGAAVAAVGLGAASQAWSLGMAVAALAVFAVFFVMFLALSRKNTRRILGTTEQLSFLLHCFDANSYLIMLVMVFLGTAVRLSTFVPGPVIASFYCGLGAALVLAGFYPLISFIASWDHARFKS